MCARGGIRKTRVTFYFTVVDIRTASCAEIAGLVFYPRYSFGVYRFLNGSLRLPAWRRRWRSRLRAVCRRRGEVTSAHGEPGGHAGNQPIGDA